MRVITERNVNALYFEGMQMLDSVGQLQESRVGKVRVAPFPVVSVYDEPCERVLFDASRNANPFFHLMEGLWMLAGRDDAEFLNHYVADFGSRFAEQGHHIHGAYGFRWRKEFGFDQLSEIVERLRHSRVDRQCVVQMWDARREHYGAESESVGRNDLRGTWLDRPCNTHAYVLVRSDAYQNPMVTDENSAEHEARIASGGDLVLDLTVCCRSNDIVLGAYGSNAVHFSMLQEYLAGMIGVRVGRMYQISNNYHAYVNGLPERPQESDDPYDNGAVFAVPMASDWSRWDADLRLFMAWHDMMWKQDGLMFNIGPPEGIHNQWFRMVAVKMAQVYWLWKHDRKPEAVFRAEKIGAPDWRLASSEWMSRRIK